MLLKYRVNELLLLVCIKPAPDYSRAVPSIEQLQHRQKGKQKAGKHKWDRTGNQGLV